MSIYRSAICFSLHNLSTVSIISRIFDLLDRIFNIFDFIPLLNKIRNELIAYAYLLHFYVCKFLVIFCVFMFVI